MGSCAAVSHTRRHRAWLVPDDILTENPPVRLKRERDSPRDSPELLPGEVAIPQIQPESGILAENPAHAPKHLDHLRHVSLWRWL